MVLPVYKTHVCTLWAVKVPTPVTPNVPPTVAFVPIATVPAVIVVVAVPELIVSALFPDVSI